MKRNNLLQASVIFNVLLIFLISIYGRILESIFFSIINHKDMEIFIGSSFILGFTIIWLILNRKIKNHKPFLYAFFICFFVMLFSQSFIIKPVEKIHLVLFSYLGLFCFYYTNLTKAIIICLIISLADEVLQYFLPNRYFGWSDVLVNSYASIVTILIFRFTKKIK